MRVRSYKGSSGFTAFCAFVGGGGGAINHSKALRHILKSFEPLPLPLPLPVWY